MSAKETGRYTSVAIALHWVIALLVIGQIIGGLYTHKLPDSQLELKFELLQWHKSFGITVLLLTIARLGWRLGHPAPALPAGMKPFEKLIARGVHAGFYVLLFAIPLAGWAVVSASPLATSVKTYLFGVVPWPHLPFFDGVADRKELSHEIAEVHEYLAFAMAGLIGLHVAAALKHQFVDRDETLSQMLPFVKGKA